jgi:hypothetical protein
MPTILRSHLGHERDDNVPGKRQLNEIAGLSRQPLAVLSLLQHHKKHKFSRQLPTHTQKEKNCSAVTVVNICSIAYTLANSVLRIAKESLHHD